MGTGQAISLVIFIVCLYFSWQVRQVLLLVFSAIVIAVALNRLVQVLQRLRIKRPIAIFLLIMQRQVSLLPAVTLASQLVFASFFGFLGLFLALPLLVVTQVWVKELLVKDVLNKR